MNYLAHLLLSGPNLDMQVGGLLGDFVKGPLTGVYPEHIEQGIRLHRHIDTLTARLAPVSQLYPLFESPWRRYAGIVIDIAFDHFLALRWPHFHTQPLAQFSTTFYRHLSHHRPHLPERAQQFSDRAPQIHWLESYVDPNIMPTILDRVGERFSRPVPLGACWHTVQANRPCFDRAFNETMPALTLFAENFMAEYCLTRKFLRGRCLTEKCLREDCIKPAK